MKKYDEILLLVAFFWLAVILASVVVLGSVMPILGALIIEIGGAIASLFILWAENQRTVKKSE